MASWAEKQGIIPETETLITKSPGIETYIRVERPDTISLKSEDEPRIRTDARFNLNLDKSDGLQQKNLVKRDVDTNSMKSLDSETHHARPLRIESQTDNELADNLDSETHHARPVRIESQTDNELADNLDSEEHDVEPQPLNSKTNSIVSLTMNSDTHSVKSETERLNTDEHHSSETERLNTDEHDSRSNDSLSDLQILESDDDSRETNI